MSEVKASARRYKYSELSNFEQTGIRTPCTVHWVESQATVFPQDRYSGRAQSIVTAPFFVSCARLNRQNICQDSIFVSAEGVERATVQPSPEMTVSRDGAANETAPFLFHEDCLAGLHRLGPFRRHDDGQYCGRVSNVSRDSNECFCYRWVLLSQSLKTRADAMELIYFMTDRFKKHGNTASSKDEPKVGENFRWTGLGQKT